MCTHDFSRVSVWYRFRKSGIEPSLILSNIVMISFTRNKFLDIINSTPDNLLPTFEHWDVLLDILVGGAVFLYNRSRRHKRGKRTCVLVKFRQWDSTAEYPSGQSPLPCKEIRQTKTHHPHKQGLDKLCALLHGNLAEWSYPGQRTSSNGLPAVQNRSGHRVVRENERWWIMSLYKWRLVYRRDSFKEDVLPKLGSYLY